jgi:hypothetical protein
MSPTRIYFLLLAVGFGGACGAAEREIRRTFSVTPGCELQVDAYRGNIVITESDRAEIEVVVGLEASAETEAEAARMLDAVRLEFGQADNRVSVVARNPRESGLRFTWQEEQLVDLQFRIAVPRRCSVGLRVIHGSAEIGNLAGRMQVQIEHGGVSFRQIDGTVDVRLGEGDLVLARCSGAVTARLLRGRIWAGTIGGRAELRNATGDIEVMAVRHSIWADAQVGEVRVGFAPEMTGTSWVRVAAGNLHAGFHPRAACRVEASATWGRVNSTLPLAVEAGGSGQRSLTGRLGGGGPRLQLRASGGSVSLEESRLMVEDEESPPVVAEKSARLDQS